MRIRCPAEEEKEEESEEEQEEEGEEEQEEEGEAEQEAEEQGQKSIPAEEEKEEESEEEKEEEGEEEKRRKATRKRNQLKKSMRKGTSSKKPTPWVPESRQESPPRQRAAGLQRPSRRVRGPPIPGTWGAPTPGSVEHVLKAAGLWKHGNLRRNRGIGNAPQKNNIRSNTGNIRRNTRSSGRR